MFMHDVKRKTHHNYKYEKNEQREKAAQKHVENCQICIPRKARQIITQRTRIYETLKEFE